MITKKFELHTKIQFTVTITFISDKDIRIWRLFAVEKVWRHL